MRCDNRVLHVLLARVYTAQHQREGHHTQTQPASHRQIANMYLANASRKTVGLLSAVLFMMLFLGLYKTMAPSPPRPQITDKLGLDSPGQASGPGPPAGQLHATTGHVLAGDLVLHDSPATYPRLTRLSDGSILLGMTRREKKQPNQKVASRVLTVKRSVDDGKTFQPWGDVVRCDGDCDNMFLLEAPPAHMDGERSVQQPPRVLAAFRNHDVDANRHHTWFRITVCESLDAGRTWRFLSQAAEKAAPNGLWEPFMRVGADGEIQMTYSQELEPRDQDTMMRSSRDGGRTWTDARTATGGDERLRDGMTGIAATSDGGRPALVMVFETTRRPGAFSVEAVVSYDNGESWGHRHVVHAPVQAKANAGAPQIEAFANGGLATVFMSDEDFETRDWPRKATVKTVFGGPLVDGKILWHSPEDACPTPSFWPGVFRLSDTQLMAACEHKGSVRGRILEWAR